MKKTMSEFDSVGVLEHQCSNTAYQRADAGDRRTQRMKRCCEKKQDDRSDPLVSYLALTLKGHPSLTDPLLHRDKDDS